MSTQIKTLTVKLSDAEIARNAKLQHVRDLRDASHPALHFRSPRIAPGAPGTC